jgi:glycosyltransferase involved in cell wall biosynthesis
MKKKQLDKISVCMTTFNGGRFVEEQIKSILCQLRAYDELIISDDGSIDDTLQIIEKINDNRVRVIFNRKIIPPFKVCENNFFVTANFENALNNVSGKFIFLCDQDDIWLPNKVEESLNALKSNKCSLVMSTINVIDSEGKVFQKNSKLKKTSFWVALKRSQFLGSTMVFDRCFLNEILPFPKYTVSHDAWIGLIANFQNKLYFIDKPLIHYRRHGNNVTAKNSNPLWFKLLYRMYFLYTVIYRTYSK